MINEVMKRWKCFWDDSNGILHLRCFRDPYDDRFSRSTSEVGPILNVLTLYETIQSHDNKHLPHTYTIPAPHVVI